MESARIEQKKYVDMLIRNHKLLSTLEFYFEKFGYEVVDMNGEFPKIFDRLKKEIINQGKLYNYNFDENQKKKINSNNKFLLKHSKLLLKHMEIPRYVYDSENEGEDEDFLKMFNLWTQLSYIL